MMNDYVKVDNLLEDLYQLIKRSRTSSIFGAKVAFDKDEALAIISEIRTNIPREIKEAKKIRENANKILNDAQHEASKIIKAGEDDVQKMISEHHITKLVKEQEEIKKTEIKEYVIGMREGAINYADSCLSDLEAIYQDSLDKFNQIARSMEDHINKELDKLYKDKQDIKTEELYN